MEHNLLSGVICFCKCDTYFIKMPTLFNQIKNIKEIRPDNSVWVVLKKFPELANNM